MKPGVLGLLALTLTAPLPAQNNAKIADIDEAFRLAGVRTMLGSLPSRMSELTTAAVTQLPRDQRQPFAPLIKEVSRELHDPDGLYRQVRAYFVQHYDAGKMATFLALERTPTYRTMQRLEEAVETPAADAGRRRFEANLKEDPPDPKRLDILRRLDNAGNTTGMQLSMVTGILGIMSDALGAQAPAGLDTKSADFKGKIQLLMADRVLTRSLYVYRNADDVDLEDYVAATEQPAVGWFNRNLQSALVAAAAERETHLSEDMKAKENPKPR